jgi:hypothetical protein
MTVHISNDREKKKKKEEGDYEEDECCRSWILLLFGS